MSTALRFIALLVLPAVMLGADHRNAATWYERAASELERIDEAEWELVHEYGHPTSEPSAELRRVLAEAGPIISMVRRGAAQEYCDYQLNYADGFGLLLPHLSRMRSAARLMRADAMVRLHDGDSTGAADRIGSMYQLAGHMGDDRIIISSLVGQAIFSLADQVAQNGLDLAAFTPADSALILEAIEPLEPSDPFDMVEGLAGEQQWAVMWLEEQFAQDDGGAERFVEQMAWKEDDRFAEFAKIDAESFSKRLAQYDSFMGEIVAAFDDPDAEASRIELERLEEELQSEEHGVLALLIMPSLGRLHAQMVAGRAMVGDRAAMLSDLAEGRTSPNDMANAAIDYIHATEMMAELDETVLAAVLAFDPDPAAVLDEDLLRALAEIDEIVTVVETGALKNRCDFEFARLAWQSYFGPTYPGALRDLFRLVYADAVRAMLAGDRDTLGERLHMMYRLIAHLDGDEPLTSALVAHVGLNDLHALTIEAAHRGLVVPSRAAGPFAAANRISSKDPFGYHNASRVLRTQLAEGIQALRIVASEDREGEKPSLDQYNDDDLLTLALLFDVVDTQRGDEAAAPHTGLRDVVDLASAIRIATEAAPQIAALSRGELDDEAIRKAPPIARVAERRAAARRDLRSVLLLLRPEPETVSSAP